MVIMKEAALRRIEISLLGTCRLPKTAFTVSLSFVDILLKCSAKHIAMKSTSNINSAVSAFINLPT